MSGARLESKFSRTGLTEGGAKKSSTTIAELYDNHARQLRAYLYSRFANIDHEDVFQSVFYNLARMPKLPDLPYPLAYLFRTAERIVIDEGRRSTTRRNHAHEVIQDSCEIKCDDITPERIVSAKRELELVTKAIKELSPQKRRLLLLYRIGDMSYSAISRSTGIPVATVHRQIGQAIQELDQLVCSMKHGQEYEHPDS